jgi:hypothetical protein
MLFHQIQLMACAWLASRFARQAARSDAEAAVPAADIDTADIGTADIDTGEVGAMETDLSGSEHAVARS